MNYKAKTFIVIPVYNESAKIKEVITCLKEEGFHNIVVVEDGSKDDSFNNLLKIKGIHLLQHIVNRGQGAAIQTGQKYAIDNKADYVVHFDGDGQHNYKEIEKLLKILIKEDLEIVIGSRFKGKNNESNVPLKKVILLKLGILFTWFTSGGVYTDTHNGFRVMTKEAAQALTISMDRFEHASEILNEIRRKKLKFKEVPVTIHYSEYSKSKGQKISNSINIMLNVLWKDILDIIN